MKNQPKPLLLLDVDGPLNPYKKLTKRGSLPIKYREEEENFEWTRHTMYPTGWEHEGLPVLLSSSMAPHFAKLEKLFTLVWATTWRHDANKWIAPILNLKDLPVIDFLEDGTEQDWTHTYPRHRGSWKTKWIAEWLDTYAWHINSAGETVRLPWVFIDDEINTDDRKWLQAHWNEPSKLVSDKVAPRWLMRIEPGKALTSKDFEDLIEWGEAHKIA